MKITVEHGDVLFLLPSPQRGEGRGEEGEAPHIL